MNTVKVSIKAPRFYNLHLTCHTHGWKNLKPFEWKDNTLYLALLVDENAIDVFVRQRGDHLEIDVMSTEKLAAMDVVIHRLRRILDLDVDTNLLLSIAETIDKKHAMIIRHGGGRRLRGGSLWEDAAKTLFTTNCTWVLTRKMAEAVCSKHFTSETPFGRFPFPTPQSIARKSEKSLNARIPIGYRAPYLRKLAKRLSVDPNLSGLEQGALSWDTAYKTVLDLAGFGEYATNHLLMMTGYFDHIPVDTSVVAFVVEAFSARKPVSFVTRRYRPWGKFKYWGYKLDQIALKKNWLGD